MCTNIQSNIGNLGYRISTRLFVQLSEKRLAWFRLLGMIFILLGLTFKLNHLCNELISLRPIFPFLYYLEAPCFFSYFQCPSIILTYQSTSLHLVPIYKAFSTYWCVLFYQFLFQKLYFIDLFRRFWNLSKLPQFLTSILANSSPPPSKLMRHKMLCDLW